MSRRRFTGRLAAGTLAAGLMLSACGSPGSSSSPETTASTGAASGGSAGASGSAAATGEPIKVGLVTSLSGPLQSYGQMYLDAFNVCLDDATDDTNAVNGRPIEVSTADDAGDPAKAISAAKDLIGKGYQIIAGSTASGVALQVAPIAAQNKVLFISGPAATDAMTGVNKYTFRSGRQSYQDVLTAASFIGDPHGKKVMVFAQDSAFGQANDAAVTAVIGGAGATVTGVLVPATATEFRSPSRPPTPIRSALRGLGRHHRPPCGRRSTSRACSTAPPSSPASTSALLAHGLRARRTRSRSWRTTSTAPPTTRWSKRWRRTDGQGKTVDLFHPDGFAAAQMVVRAAQESPDDVDGMVTALEGWSSRAQGHHDDPRRGPRDAAADVPGQAGRHERDADPRTGQGTGAGRTAPAPKSFQ